MRNKIEKFQKKINFIELFDDSTFAPTDLGSLEVGLFSVSRKNNNNKNPKQEKIIKLNDLLVEGVSVEVEILTHKKYGLLIVSDLTKYFGFLKIVLDNYKTGQEIKNPIEFSCYELMVNAKLSRRGGYKKNVHDWIERMASTQIIITGESLDNKGRRREIHHIFDKVVLSDAEDEEGNVIDKNQIWLSNWMIDNITRRPILPIDLDSYHKIENDTAKLLVTHLQSWLYSSRTSHYFQKDYKNFCDILNIKEYKYKYDREKQLKEIFYWLKKFEYVEKYKLEPMKTKEGFKILIWHGKKFYRDLEKAFTLIKNKIPEDLPLQLESQRTNKSNSERNESDEKLVLEKRIKNLSKPQKEFFNYLMEIPLFKKTSVELLEKFELTILKRKIAHALDITDAKISKGVIKEKDRGRYCFGIIKNDEVPEDFKLPEEIAEEEKKMADEKKRKEEEDFKNFQLEMAWENYKELEAERLFNTLEPNKQKQLGEYAFEKIRKNNPNYCRFYSDEKLAEEFIILAKSELKKESEVILSFAEFCQTDGEENLIKTYYSTDKMPYE